MSEEEVQTYPDGVVVHECNDCGILIDLSRPICTLCELWYEERGELNPYE